MNAINTIRLDLNTARYQSAVAKKKVLPVEVLKSSTGNDKKRQFKSQLINDFDSHKNSSDQSNLIISNTNNKFYKANLLNEIVNKMSGLENNPSPGQYVEYYA